MSLSAREHAKTSGMGDRQVDAEATPGRQSLAAHEEEGNELEWEAVDAAEYDVGSQLEHLGKAAAEDGSAEKASTEQEQEDEEGEVDASLAPDADSGGDTDAGGDDDDDDDDDDDEADEADGDEPGALTARAASAGAGPAATPPADTKASKRWQREIDARVEQRKVKKQPKRKNAATNRFNNKRVRANHLSKDKKKRKHQIDRAGVRFRDQDKFSPIADRVKRYRIIEGNIATSDGVKDAVRGGKDRLAINPASVRNLELEDGTKLGPCVLTWHGGRRAAWMPISQIKLATTKTDDPKKLKAQQAGIERAVSRRARQWRSDVAGKSALKNAAHFTFGGNGARSTAFDKSRYIVPRQRKAGANKVSDYLLKDDGTTFNVMINLPRDRQAPIAVDTTVMGDHFYVPKTGGVIQEVSIYKRGKNETKVRARQTWVFGHVGADRETGGGPDEKRRGWVPLRVLDPVK